MAVKRASPVPETPPAPIPATAGLPPRVKRAVHDMRQPLQAMRLFVHLLSTRLESEQDRALVGKLDGALDHMEAALRGLIDSVASSDAPGPDAATDDAPSGGGGPVSR